MIKAHNLIKIYKNGESDLRVLDDLTFEIPDDEFVVILGASGSGKSTLLNVLSGTENANSGEIVYDSEDISKYSQSRLTKFRREKVGFIFQAYYLLPFLSVTGNIKMGADLSDNKNIGSIIEAVGLKGKENKFPKELSGGEQQRVSIARAVAKSPKYLFCDEPTGALDEKTGRQILKYLLELKKEKNFTMIMVTHNENIAQLADRVIKMNSGKIVDFKFEKNPKTVDEISW